MSHSDDSDRLRLRQMALGRAVLQDALAGDRSGRRRKGRGQRRARQAGQSAQGGRRGSPSPRVRMSMFSSSASSPERRGPASVAQTLYEETEPAETSARGSPRSSKWRPPRSCTRRKAGRRRRIGAISSTSSTGSAARRSSRAAGKRAAHRVAAVEPDGVVRDLAPRRAAPAPRPTLASSTY